MNKPPKEFGSFFYHDHGCECGQCVSQITLEECTDTEKAVLKILLKYAESRKDTKS